MEGLPGDLHEDHLVLDASREHVSSIGIIVLFLARLDQQEGLPLDVLGVGRRRRESDHVRAGHRAPEELVTHLEVFDCGPIS